MSKGQEQVPHMPKQVLQREWGRIVLAKGRPKREIRDGAVGANINVLNRQTFTFDNCICTIVRHSVGAVLPDLHCKRVSLSERLLSLVRVCVCNGSE